MQDRLPQVFRNLFFSVYFLRLGNLTLNYQLFVIYFVTFYIIVYSSYMPARSPIYSFFFLVQKSWLDSVPTQFILALIFKKQLLLCISRHNFNAIALFAKRVPLNTAIVFQNKTVKISLWKNCQWADNRSTSSLNLPCSPVFLEISSFLQMGLNTAYGHMACTWCVINECYWLTN